MIKTLLKNYLVWSFFSAVQVASIVARIAQSGRINLPPHTIFREEVSSSMDYLSAIAEQVAGAGGQGSASVSGRLCHVLMQLAVGERRKATAGRRRGRAAHP